MLQGIDWFSAINRYQSGKKKTGPPGVQSRPAPRLSDSKPLPSESLSQQTNTTSFTTSINPISTPPSSTDDVDIHPPIPIQLPEIEIEIEKPTTNPVLLTTDALKALSLSKARQPVPPPLVLSVSAPDNHPNEHSRAIGIRPQQRNPALASPIASPRIFMDGMFHIKTRRPKALQMLSRTSDSAFSWYTDMFDRFHCRDPLDVPVRRQALPWRCTVPDYKWYKDIAQNFVMRGRDGRVLLPKAAKRPIPMERPLSFSEWDPDYLLSPDISIGSSTGRRPDLSKPDSYTSVSRPGPLAWFESAPSVMNAQISTAVDIPLPDPASTNSISGSRRFIATRRRTVCFNKTVHLGSANSADEYERAGPDTVSQYRKMPVEERRKVNSEIDRYVFLNGRCPSSCLWL